MTDSRLTVNAAAEVPEGYKRTEVGVIPEDWEVAPLKELIEPNRKITYGIVVPGPNIPNGIPMIRAQDYSRGWVDLGDLYRVSFELDKSYKRSKVVAGDVLLTIVGSVGNLAKVPDPFSGSNLTQQTARLAFNSQLADTDFYLNFLRSEVGQREILNYQKSGVQPSLNLSDVERFHVVLPPLPEQRSIAQALTDVDALLAALDKLITKKRNLKTATMQQLLTGQTRLPGFGEGKGYKETEVGVIPEDWEVMTLSDVCSAIIDGTHYTPLYVSNGIPFYSVENVTANNFDNIKYISYEEHLKLIKRCKPEKGDVLLTRIGSLGITSLIDWDIDASIYVSLALLKLDEAVNIEYVYSYTKSHQFIEDVKKRSLVNATPQKINMEDIGKVPILVPKSADEQTAIAQVLSDMDHEITALQQRRHKTQKLKQGMMQELLTGRIRLL